ncbi:hypothetical protein TNCV_5036481 [Trichonephila clavipes]|nr:hypothetical protein TNCV_5036481 [Trichonephila clavipes]
MKGKVPGPAAENDPQTVSDPPPCFTVGFKFCLRNSSFDFLQTYGLPSDPNILNLLSSVNNTCFQETSCTPLIDWGGRGSLVVKVTDSWPPCHEFDPRTAKDPPCRGAMHVNCRELKLPLVGVVWYLGYGVPTQVSASSLDYVSKLRATRGLLATDLVTLNYGQVTRTTPELPPPSSNYHINGRTFELSTDLTSSPTWQAFRAARGLLAMDHVILNHGQVTWTTPELAPTSPNYHTTPTGGRFSSRQI